VTAVIYRWPLLMLLTTSNNGRGLKCDNLADALDLSANFTTRWGKWGRPLI